MSLDDLRGFYPKLARQGIFKGVDLKLLVERFWRLESMRVDGRCSAPEVRWRAASDYRGSGAHIAMRVINLNMCQFESIERVAEVLLHELVHCSLPPREGHSELFCRRLIACAREAFGLELDIAALLSLKAVGGVIAYAIDDAIVKVMTAATVGDQLREGAETKYTPPPPENEEEVAARVRAARAAGQAKAAAVREARARAKLAEWEARLERTKRVASKWRTKVRYYDRRQLAAKTVNKTGSDPSDGS